MIFYIPAFILPIKSILDKNYVTKLLMLSRQQVQDNANDGIDAIRTV